MPIQLAKRSAGLQLTLVLENTIACTRLESAVFLSLYGSIDFHYFIFIFLLIGPL